MQFLLSAHTKHLPLHAEITSFFAHIIFSSLLPVLTLRAQGVVSIESSYSHSCLLSGEIPFIGTPKLLPPTHDLLLTTIIVLALRAQGLQREISLNK
jgi:hypothetical protein